MGRTMVIGRRRKSVKLEKSRFELIKFGCQQRMSADIG
jgi:hypothetical protein